MFFVLLILLLNMQHLYAMRTQPIKRSNEFSIVLADGHAKMSRSELRDCPVAMEQRELQKMTNTALKLELSSFTTEDWRDFEYALKDDEDDTRGRLSNKKRARAILEIADFLGHQPLTELGAKAYAQHAFAIDDLNPILAPLVAQKILENTPLLKEFPCYLAALHQLKSNIKHVDSVNWSCCHNPLSGTIALGSKEGILSMYCQIDGILTRHVAHGDAISGLQCSADGKHLFSVARDGTIKQWNMLLYPISLERQYASSVDYPFNVEVHPRGQYFATDDNNSIKVWNMETGDIHMSLEIGRNRANGIKYNRNGTLLAVGNCARNVEVYDTVSGNCLTVMGLGESASCQLQFNDDSTILAIGCKNGSIHFFNLTLNTFVTTVHEHREHVWCLEFIPNTQFMISGSADKKVKLWDLETFTCFYTRDYPRAINDMRLTKENTIILAITEDRIRIIDLKPFLKSYLETKKFLTKNLTFEQAQLIKKAFDHTDIHSDEGYQPVHIGKDPEKSVFKSLPDDLQLALRKKFPKSIITRKKHKSADDSDDDYVISNQSE